MAAALMVLGTASNVGKSWVCTGLCRLLSRRGYRVAPFKAQNMSNNAAPARTLSGGWGEIGRAQAAQAAAAGLEPHVDMNPLLFKPTASGSQIVLLGEPLGHMRVLRYSERLPEWAAEVRAAYDRLAARYDIIVLEGAGSPAEINLKSRDIVNMSMASHAISRARASNHPGSCLLVGDIERGGVFASLYGTLALLEPSERALITGVIINRFRGDRRLLEPGPTMFAERAGVPVLGVLPYRSDIAIDEEDSQDLHSVRGGEIDICVIRLPTVSNFTDTASLSTAPGTTVRYTTTNEDLGRPDLLILPGAKDTVADLRWLRACGLDRGILAAASRGVPILGLCGGYQMLGERILDTDGVGGSTGSEAGLGLLPVQTHFSESKRVREVSGRTRGGWLLPEGLPVRGYEIHQGRTTASAAPLLSLPGGELDGAISGLVAGSYLHGLLDDSGVRTALIDALRARRALPPLSAPVEDMAAFRSRQYDAAADVIEEHVDLTGLLP
jgi:adenosylcobyric acid synthase